MDKSVISVNPSKIRLEIVPSVSRGVALGVYREEDIVPFYNLAY